MGFPRITYKVFSLLEELCVFWAHFFRPTANLKPEFIASDYTNQRIQIIKIPIIRLMGSKFWLKSRTMEGFERT